MEFPCNILCVVGRTCDITQMSAVGPNGRTFNKYVLPTKPISKGATEATLLTCEDGVMYHRGQPVPTVTIAEALASFLEYLALFDHPCLLVAHNCKSFDSRIFMFHVKNNEMINAFKEVCLGFSDSLLIFKTIHPERKTQKLSYKQNELCKDYLNLSYDAHNSLEDVKALQKLCSAVDMKLFLDHSFTFQFVSETNEYSNKKQKNVSSMQNLLGENVISKSMIDKIASSGLSFHHLNLAFQRDSVNGVKNVLSEKIDGKPRVTNRNCIISKIQDYLEQRQVLK